MKVKCGNSWRLVMVIGYIATTFGLSSIKGGTLAHYISGYDLLLHGIEYALLAGLMLWYWSHTEWGSSNFKRAGWIAVIICAMVGGLNELWQSQVPGRFPAVDDEVANVVGSGVATVVYYYGKRGKVRELES